jgi:hypothetical protein
MSTLDLKTLLSGRSGVRSPVASGAVDQPPVRLPEAQVQAQTVGLRAMDKWCEVMRTGKASGGFGLEDEANTLVGASPCRFGWKTRTSEEAALGVGVKNVQEGELVLPINFPIRTQDRVAIPAWFDEWRRFHVYSISATGGQRCIPSNLDSGTGYFFEVVQEGTSGSTEPNWTDQLLSTVADGSVVWRCMGQVLFLEVTGEAGNGSWPNERAVTVKLITGS